MANNELREFCVETKGFALKFGIDESGKLFQTFCGSKCDPDSLPVEAFPAYGDGWIYEPAVSVLHADGNSSTDLRVTEVVSIGDVTRIKHRDPEYPFSVDLVFRAYSDLDVIEAWTEISHQEPGAVVLSQFASSSLDFGNGRTWLTQFHGDWSDEANMKEEELTFGIKTLDSKIGVRSHQFRSPWFLLSKGAPAAENSGEVVGGSLAWSGSFAFTFEVDEKSRLRANCGINAFASSYQLEPNDVFETPKMVWGYSATGTGALSRNLHHWVRKHALREGETPRAVLLNNWEATYFTFDEAKIVSLFDGAKELGIDLFLLDDGWFGTKYPRDDDSQGLGDWEPDPKKLPNGIKALTEAAKERGLRFGIWLEPEMVNPRSELFENHPDWVIRQPKRELHLKRNQLILDLSQPEVREFVYEVAHRTLTENPDISYVKWDCNRYVTQPGSPALDPTRGSHLLIDYNRALYDVFERLSKQHPHVEIMMCSGGGGRVDYGAMRYAHELWPSDQTDPVKRIFIQWGFSHFFPAIAISAHVTNAGDRPIKFAFDVAMSGRLGMDMDLDQLSPEDRSFAGAAIREYKEIREIVQLGELYRLESPYEGPRSALMYVNGENAVVFVYSLGLAEDRPLLLDGLDSEKTYQVSEINLAGGATGISETLEGESLTKVGIPIPILEPYSSIVLKISPALNF